MRTRSLLGAAASAAALLGAQPAMAPAAPPPAGGERLSDELTMTRWAHANEAAPVRSSPRRDARRVDRLRLWTEDARPEIYLLMERRRDAGGRSWVRVRLPGRPNGRTGWTPQAALGDFHLVRTHLRVNRRTLRATLYHGGRRIWQARIGVGAPGTPTPAGRYWIRERLRGAPGSIYGPVAFGTAAYSRLSDWPGGGVIGIHGTNRPELIPGRPSHGCIRIRNRAILRLARLMPLGTPVRIL